MSELLVTPDFSEVQDQVEPGIYKVRVVGHKLDKWEGKDGKPPTNYINWTLEEFGAADPKNNGRKHFHKTALNGKGAFRLQAFYKATMGENIGASGFDPTMLYGKEVEITVVENPKQPEYTDIKTVKKLQ